MGEPGLDGEGRGVTGSVPDMPDELDQPSGQFDQAAANADDGVTYSSYAEFLDREQPEMRPATYADKDECFFVTRPDGSQQAMVLEFKDYVAPSEAALLDSNDPFAAEIAKTLRSAERSFKVRKRARRARLSPQKLTGLAVFIAGRKRAALGTEWRAHLSGETGAGLPADRQTREAAGFILASVRYRLQDAADLVWQPADAVLASRKLSNLVALVVTLATAVISIHGNGLYGLVSNLANTAVAWGATFGLIHYGRKWRDVKLPERKPRRERQQR